jgi:hypothetical protein
VAKCLEHDRETSGFVKTGNFLIGRMPVGKPKRNQPAELFEIADKTGVVFSSGIKKIM